MHTKTLGKGGTQRTVTGLADEKELLSLHSLRSGAGFW